MLRQILLPIRWCERRVYRGALGLGCLAAALVPAVTGMAAHGQDLFAEDFDGDLSRWANVGSATQVEGRLRVPAGSGQMRSRMGTEVWDDYVIEVDVEIEAVAAGLVFRSTDAEHAYLWQLHAGSGALRLHAQRGGTYELLKEVSYPFTTGVGYRVHIEANGPVITTRINQVLVDTHRDVSYARGAIGFRHGSTESAFYDAIKITRILPDLPVAPGVPVGFQATPDEEAGRPVVKLRWRPGAGTPRGWTLARRAAGAGPFAPLTGLHTGVTAFVDRWVEAATTYAYQIRAHNSGGASPLAEAAATTGAIANPAVAIPAPSGLLANNLTPGMSARLTQRDLRFGWGVGRGLQSAYQILVASRSDRLEAGVGDLWDSGKVTGDASLGVPYAGAPLADDATYAWSVRTWNGRDEASPYADAAILRTGSLTEDYATDAPAVIQREVAPTAVVRKAPGHYFIDFGRAAFGTVAVHIASPDDGQVVEVHLGEACSDATTVHRDPVGTVRYRQVALPLRRGQTDYRLTIPPFEYPSWVKAHVPMPPDLGEVMPFRYVEVIHVPDPFTADQIRQLATHVPFDDQAASFTSSDRVLNDVWDLCAYSIQATTYTGIYVDGDRERTAYEADAYLNQLCQYGVDRNYVTPRLSHEHLLRHPTWPTEWKFHSIYMAWMDYLYTGDDRSMRAHYPILQTKTLLSTARPDGLLPGADGDIVDWPAGERDGYDMKPVKTVVSATHYQALVWMAEIAEVLGHAADADHYRRRAERVNDALNRMLWDAPHQRYIDGMDDDGTPSSHASIHANLFPLAFGMVPADRVDAVVRFIKGRGMACSVYPAQYLLEGMYAAGEADYALSLMNATGIRSWANMIYNVGSTITLEAWDPRFKPNLDWNHAWGAVPANVIPRYLLGVRPLEPGFCRILIQPQPGNLAFAHGTVPTPRGPVRVSILHNRPARFSMEIEVPPNTTARAGVPALGGASPALQLNGAPVTGTVEAGTVWLDPLLPGRYLIDRTP